jgi:hypothetical protein
MLKEKRMKRATFIVFLLVLWLSTCNAPEPNMLEPMDVAPTQTDVPATETAVPAMETTLPPTPTEAPVSGGKLPASSFDSQPYINEEAGFALDIPTGWTINEVVVGPRGTQIQFLSKPELADAAVIPEGETRVNATIYLWDPKNDLDAYVEHRKTAWEASGFTILEEEPLTLELGLPAVLFTIQTSETQFVVLLAALRDSYLEINGEGDLELVKEIALRLRPISQ